MRLMEPIDQPTLKPRTGDLFAYLMRGEYGFGQVIRTDLDMILPVSLIYLYKDRARDLKDLPNLSIQRLAIPPLLIASLSWEMGVLKTISAVDSSTMNTLVQHCFWDEDHGEFRNEIGEILLRKSEPCGKYSCSSIHGLELQLGIAFGYVSSMEEWNKLPDLPGSDIKFPRTSASFSLVDVLIPHQEFDSLGLDRATIELALNQRLSSLGVAELDETGFDEDYWCLAFTVKPRKRKEFIQTVRAQMELLGIRGFKVVDSISGKTLK